MSIILPSVYLSFNRFCLFLSRTFSCSDAVSMRKKKLYFRIKSHGKIQEKGVKKGKNSLYNIRYTLSRNVLDFK